MPTVQEILAETTSFIQAKQASFEGKKAMTGQDPSSMPGSEHDSAVPGEMGQPDKEVNDGTQGPKSSRSTEGAGDDSEVTRGHAVDAEEACCTPKSEPAVSADANAKAATAELCNDLLESIQAYRTDVASKEAKDLSGKQKKLDVDGDGEIEGSDLKKLREKKAEEAPEAPEAPEAAEEASAEEAKEAEEAPGLNLELTSEFLQKIGAILLSTEEGTQFVDEQLRKHAGAVAADEMMGFIACQNEEAEKIAAAEQGAADANALISDLQYSAGYQAAQEEIIGKQAEFAEEPTTLAKLGQEVADASIEDLMGAAGPEMNVAPEEMGAEGAMGSGGAMGAMGAEGAMGDEEFTEEDVVAALELLVSQGELDPQDAQAIMDQIGAGGAEEMPEAMPEEMPEEAVTEEAPAEEPVEA